MNTKILVALLAVSVAGVGHAFSCSGSGTICALAPSSTQATIATPSGGTKTSPSITNTVGTTTVISGGTVPINANTTSFSVNMSAGSSYTVNFVCVANTDATTGYWAPLGIQAPDNLTNVTPTLEGSGNASYESYHFTTPNANPSFTILCGNNPSSFPIITTT